MALGLFRVLAAVARNMIVSNTFGSAALLVIFFLDRFIMPKDMIKPWWKWGFWMSPLSYAQRAIAVNEFFATRWMQELAGTNSTVGYSVLEFHDLPRQTAGKLPLNLGSPAETVGKTPAASIATTNAETCEEVAIKKIGNAYDNRIDAKVPWMPSFFGCQYSIYE